MLFKKLMKDIYRHKFQFISIFLMSFLAVFFYTGIGGEWMGLRTTANDYYAETNFADAWIYGNTGFNDSHSNVLKEIEGVVNVEKRLSVNTTANLIGNPTLVLHFIEKNEISKFYTSKGDAFDLDADGIWLDEKFADMRGIKLHDEITVTYHGITLTKKVLGIGYSPEYVFMGGDSMTPDFYSKGFAYLPAMLFPFPQIVYSEMLINTTTADFDALEKEIDHALQGRYSVLLKRNELESYVQFDMEIAQHKSMGELFPIVFVLVALLTISTTMTRLVSGQRLQIGTLKALGFSKRKILFHYVSYGFFIVLLGALLGVLLGPLVVPPLFYPSMSAFYTMPVWKPVYHYSFFIMAGITVLLSTMATIFACQKILKLSPSETLRTSSDKKIRRTVLEKTAIWNKVGFNIQWNVRDMSRNIMRSIMAIVGALGCSALLICAFSMQQDMEDLKIWQYHQINQFNTKIVLDEKIDEKKLSNILTFTNGEQLLESAIEIRSKSLKYSGTITVTDDTSLIKFTDHKRHMIELDRSGVHLSYKMAEQLNVQVGDIIEWHLFSEEGWKTCVVSSIYRHPTMQGLAMDKEVFLKFYDTFTPTSVISILSEINEQLEGAKSVIYKEELTNGWDSLTEAMLLMVYILIAAATILAVVVLYNLGLLSFTEMEREMATLKVLGFKTSKLRLLLLTQNMILSLIGFMVGIPIGWILVKIMINDMGDSFDMIAALHFTDILFTFLIVVAISFAVNLLFSGKIKKIDMVSSLKSND